MRKSFTGLAPIMRDHLAGSEAPGLQCGLEVAFAGDGEEEAGGEEVAGAGDVDHFGHGIGRHGDDLAIVDRHGALLTHGDGGELGILGDGLHGAVEIGLVQRLQLFDIAEDDVHGLGPDQVEELVAVAVDAERVAERERGRPVVLVGVVGGLHERLLGLGRIPQKPFHVGDGWRRRSRLP